MRKGWLAIAVVALLGVGYLGAQAYSSHIFERELTRSLDALRANGQWQAAREDVERGWFHSRGRLLLAPSGSQAWRVAIPYQASHGLLSTRIGGALQAYFRASPDAAEQALFGDQLSSAEPRWTATLHTLDRRATGRLDIAAFDLRRGESQLTFAGAQVTFDGRAGDIHAVAQVAPLQLQGARGDITSGPLHIESRYQFSGAGRFKHQRNMLRLESLTYQGQQRPSVTLNDLRYSDETRLDDQLRVDASLSLEQVLVAGQTLLSGSLDARLDRIDGAAVREVMARLAVAAERHGGELGTLDDEQRQALLEQLKPALLAALSDSPRLTVNGLTLSSPMFGIDAQGHGELIFDGENVASLPLGDLDEPANIQAWRERLDGTFRVSGVPPLVALQLGLPPDTDTLEGRIDSGVLRVNGQRLALLE